LWLPLVADVDGDGKVDFGTWDGLDWNWQLSLSNYAWQSLTFSWGDDALGDIPLAADLDGDRRADGIVWRESTGTWYWLTSRAGWGGFAALKHWGQ
jgi:hypothetical protein